MREFLVSLRMMCWAAVAFAVPAQAQRGLRQAASRARPAVLITGAFHEDGGCEVFADGIPVFSALDSARTSYIRGAMLNTAPSGFETHEVWCAPRSDDQPMPPLDARERAFVIIAFPPAGTLLAARTYLVRTGMATPATAARQANAALFGMSPPSAADSTTIRIGMVYLAGTRGTFTVTRASELQVVGTFSMHGQRALSM